MRRRKTEVTHLTNAITDHDWGLCCELCFKILFGLPSEVPIELTCFMLHRYLPIFDVRHPEIIWPKEILNDIGKWVNKFGRVIPDEPEEISHADYSFVFCFDALLLAYTYRENQAALTRSCVVAIYSAIAARVTNVWEADDPDSVVMWEQGPIPPQRTSLGNVACIAIKEREWNIVLEWLIKKKVWAYPNDVNLSEMQQALEEWVHAEMTLGVPKEEWERFINE